MSKSKEKDNKPVSLKKETLHQIHNQLSTTLSWLKELLGDKKFNNRVKKASRILSDGIKEKKAKKIKPQKVKPAASEPISS